jgi:hypothetical protein
MPLGWRMFGVGRISRSLVLLASALQDGLAGEWMGGWVGGHAVCPFLLSSQMCAAAGGVGHVSFACRFVGTLRGV